MIRDLVITTYLAQPWHSDRTCRACRTWQRITDAGIDVFFALDFARARRAAGGR